MADTLLPPRRRKPRQAVYRRRAGSEGPRLRLPKLELSPAQRRRLSGLLLGGVLLGLTGFGLAWSLRPQALPVGPVYLSQALQRVPAETVRGIVAEFAAVGWLHLDLPGLERRLRQLPWVAHVEARREWPNQLHIGLREYQAAAVWVEHAQPACGGLRPRCPLVSETGAVFAVPVSEFPEGLPLLKGPDGSAVEVLAYYRTLAPMLQAADLGIQSLALDSRRAWRLTLNNGTPLLLGRAGGVGGLQRFVRVYPYLLRSRPQHLIKHVDLRYTNGIAVEWQTQAEPGATAG